jgi:hypothetical protein
MDRSSDFPSHPRFAFRALVAERPWLRETQILRVTAAAPCRTFTGLPKVDFPPPLAGLRRRQSRTAPGRGRQQQAGACPGAPTFEGAETLDLCFCEGALTSKFFLSLAGWSLLLVGLCASSCHPPPQAVAAGPTTTAPPAPPPPPPPPPKCEALTENCTATESTLLDFGAQGATLTPPSGWTYAKLADRSVALSAEGKSILVATEIADGSDAAILASLEQLTAASLIEKVKFEALKKRFKKPQITVDGKDAKVDLWEVSKATSNGVNPELHEQGAGTLLVFVSRLADNRVVTGLGFVVVPEAEADAAKVMAAVQSLKGKP